MYKAEVGTLLVFASFCLLHRIILLGSRTGQKRLFSKKRNVFQTQKPREQQLRLVLSRRINFSRLCDHICISLSVKSSRRLKLPERAGGAGRDRYTAASPRARAVPAESPRRAEAAGAKHTHAAISGSLTKYGHVQTSFQMYRIFRETRCGERGEGSGVRSDVRGQSCSV